MTRWINLRLPSFRFKIYDNPFPKYYPLFVFVMQDMMGESGKKFQCIMCVPCNHGLSMVCGQNVICHRQYIAVEWSYICLK